MSDPPSIFPRGPDAGPPDEISAGPSGAPVPRPRPSRLRRFFLRHLPLSVGAMTVLAMVALVGLYFFASSGWFEGMVRQRLVDTLERTTGGRVEIASFHWRVLALEADADGVVIHGLEGPGEAPYASIGRVRVRVSVLDLMAPRIVLRDLEIDRPAFHFIVYPDGETNQPHPRRATKHRPLIDTLFRLQAGHIEIEQGMLHYEDRAASFDYQDRYIPLSFKADDLSVLLRYVPAGDSAVVVGESYRIELGASDLALERGGPKSVIPAVHGYVQATLDLTRNAVYLGSLRLTARSHEGKDHALEISGALKDFAQPRWQAKMAGELDMRLLDPLTGYTDAPEGMARLELTAAGSAGEFRIDGAVHVEDGSYIGTGMVASGVGLDAHVHADPERLVITSIVARFRQGGQMAGVVDLHPWLPALPGAAKLEPASQNGLGKNDADKTGARNRNFAPPPPPPLTIQVPAMQSSRHPCRLLCLQPKDIPSLGVSQSRPKEEGKLEASAPRSAIPLPAALRRARERVARLGRAG